MGTPRRERAACNGDLAIAARLPSGAAPVGAQQPPLRAHGILAHGTPRWLAER
jgi:hypothetical protein